MASSQDSSAFARAKFIEDTAKEQRELKLAQGAEKKNFLDLQDEEMRLIVERVKKGDEKREEAKEKVKTTFRIDVETMKKLAASSRKRNLCQLMFCFVIMGCELDLIGFFGAFPGYWALGIPMVRGLLVAMPSSYMICIMLYFCYIQPEEQALHQKASAHASSGNNLQKKARALLRRSNVRLSLYHFLPMARYILLIKSTTSEDVEGIFRVNSLSSFTLGSCQLVGLLFTIMHNGNSIVGLSIFVYMNMFSQLVNWSITLLYFATSVADGMKKSIASGAYSANLSSQMRKTMVALQVSIAEDAENLAQEGSNVMDALEDDASKSSRGDASHLSVIRKTLENEIDFFKQTAVDLSYFDPIELLTIRRAVYIQFAEEFNQS